jgi:single-stranded DNA-specific DHH superfamily exonuclease
MPDPRYQVLDTHPLGVSALRLAELTKDFHRKLLKEAKAYLGANQPEMAVVLAEASAEQCTEWAFTSLFAIRKADDLGELIVRRFRGTDICNKGVRAVYTSLSKDKPEQRPFWEELKRHNERRNSIVHRGAKCTIQEAESSVASADSYVAHVEGVVAHVGGS